MSLPSFEIEKNLKGNIIGIDEVGRGPLAGPVISCAFIFLDYQIDKEILLLIDDSKKLSIKKKEVIFKKIIELKKVNKIKYELGMSNVYEIDKYNILEATKISMRRAIEKLNVNNAQLIIDGNINLASGSKALIIFLVPTCPTVLISSSFCPFSDFT